MRRVVLALMLVGTAAFAGRGPFNGGPFRGGPVSEGPFNSATALASVTTFDLNIGDTGSTGSALANLPTDMTINGITVQPSFVYLGKDAGASTWAGAGFGPTLTLSGGGAPTRNLDTPLTATADRAVTGALSGAAYDAASASSVDLTTEDVVLEIVAQGTNGYTYASKNATGPTSGWELDGQAGTLCAPRFNLNVGGTLSVDAIQFATCNVWFHAIIFVDRSGSAQWYVNGVASAAPTVVSGSQGSATSANPMRILGRPATAGQTLNSTGLAYIAMWKRDNWLDTHLQPTIAMQRFTAMLGIYPQIAKGSPVPTFSRASTKYCDVDRDSDGVRRLFLLGNGWPCVAKRKEASTSTRYNGYLPEPQATNLCLQSQTTDNASWVKTACAVTANTGTAPDSTVTMDSIVADGTNASHFVAQTIAMTAATVYTVSRFEVVGNKNFVGLFTNDLATPNGVMFNVSTCTVGGKFAATANVTGIAEPYGNSCRISMTFTAAATAGFDIRVYTSGADWTNNSTATEVFTGDSVTVNEYGWGGQFEAGSFSTSYIPTVASTVTRSADDLRFATAGNVSAGLTGAVVVKTMAAPGLSGAVGPSQAISIGTTTADFIAVSTTGGQNARYSGAATAGGSWTIDTTANTWNNGNLHTLRGTWAQDSFAGYYDGAAYGTPDVSGNVPVVGNTIFVGERETGTLQFNGGIVRIRILSSPVPGTASAP